MMAALFSNSQLADIIESNRNASKRLREQITALSDELAESEVNLKICREKNRDLKERLLLSHYVTLMFAIMIAVWFLYLVTSMDF